MPNSTFKLYKLILLCMFFFSVVGCKFNNYEYNSITEVIGDIRLILENCYRYNGSDHWVSKLGHKMEKILEQKLALLNRCKFQTIQYLRLQKSHVFQCWCNWRLEETFRVTVISINIFFYVTVMVKRVAVKPLPDLVLCIYLVWGNVFLSGKSHWILSVTAMAGPWTHHSIPVHPFAWNTKFVTSNNKIFIQHLAQKIN